MASIKKFNEFLDSVFESDGFGTKPFLLRKEKDIFNYLFYIDTGEEGKQDAFRLMIGKYSSHQVIDQPKNSYCVLSVNKISSEQLEDISVTKADLPPTTSAEFKMSESDVSRLFETVSKCILDYLEYNAKVSKIYDEIQDNLVFKGEGTYMEFMKSIVISYLGEDWSVQEGVDKNSILISR